ncbi:M66 family metalloprotease, partial [Vibrio mediterranei]|uniref:M66 family metalloprotease n=1 Tax=Vibrio mediterranei TaxID=689 RepID=UPI0016BC6EDF
GQVEFIQNSTSLPFGNENIPYQKLVSERESLFLFTPEVATDAPLFLTLSLEGKKKKIKLSRPEDLPKSDQPVDDSRTRLEYSTQAWSTTIGWEWMKPGLSVTISNESGEQSQVEASIFEWGAPSKLVFNMMRIGMLGKVREINGLEKEPLRLGQDYFDVMPISELVISNYLPVELDTVVMPNGDIYTDASPDLGTWHAGDMRSDIAKGLFSVGLNNASFGITSSYGDSASQPEYYNNRMVHQAAGVYRNGYIIHGGSGGNGMLTMDNLTRGNELTHEAGHSYGQSHYLRSGKYASHNLFSGWTYDTAHRQLRANIDWNDTCETPESCINEFSQQSLPNEPNYQTEPFKGIYRFGTDAQAGGHQSSSIASYTNHTAYSNRSIQQYLNSRANLDESSSSGYVIWDDKKQAMVPLNDDARQRPLSIGVPVTSLVGFYDPSGKLNGYAYQPLVSNYGTTFDYPSAQNIQDCTATVSTKNSESISFGVRGDQSNSGVMNRYHVNLPLDAEPTHIQIECPVFIELDKQYDNWLLDKMDTDKLLIRDLSNNTGTVGDIYVQYHNKDVYYWRLKDETYWYYPAPGSSNQDWEYLGSKERFYPEFEAEVKTTQPIRRQVMIRSILRFLLKEA